MEPFAQPLATNPTGDTRGGGGHRQSVGSVDLGDPTYESEHNQALDYMYYKGCQLRMRIEPLRCRSERFKHLSDHFALLAHIALPSTRDMVEGVAD